MRTLLLIFFFVNLLTAQVRLRDGEFLSSEYIEVLKRSKSPAEAGGLASPYVARVEFVADSSFNLVLGNFHEGETSLSFENNKFVGVTPQWPSNIDFSIILVSPTQFIVKDKSNYKKSFIYVGDTQLWAKSILFLGVYNSSGGQSFRFTETHFYYNKIDSTSYKVLLDLMGPPGVDCIYTPKDMFAFKIIGRTFKLYKVYGTDNTIVAKKAKWILNKIN